MNSPLTRTTVTLPQDLLFEIKRIAVEERKTFKEVITNALSQAFGISTKKEKHTNPLFSLTKLKITGGPKDLSTHLDDYLYGEKE